MINQSDPKLKTLVLDGFKLGLNQFDSDMDLRPDELANAQNVRLNGRSGTVESVLGQQGYLDTSHAVLSAGVRNAWRYQNADGAKKVIIQSGSKVYADSDDGKFTEIAEIATNDGVVRFAQYRSALIMATEREDTRVWHPDHGVGFLTADTPTLYHRGHLVTGGALDPQFYVYRFTVDLSLGEDFIVETGPLVVSTLYGGVDYTQFEIDLTTGTGIEGTKFDNLVLGSTTMGGLTITRLNIYRSLPQAAAGAIKPSENDPNFFLIASLTPDQLPPTAAYTDNGDSLFGRQIQYDTIKKPPRARFPMLFRSQLFMANCEIWENDAWVKYPNRVYWSKLGANGVEIGAFTDLGATDVDPDDGNPITGIARFRDHTLVVFKSNEVWRIRFQDGELFRGIPNYAVDQVSAQVGCVAPQTIKAIDGTVTWLSGDTAYYYDGQQARELGSGVHPTLSAVPANKRRFVTAGYNATRKELTYYHAGPTEQYNRYATRLDTRYKRWSQCLLEHGVGHPLYVADDDGTRKQLLCLWDEESTFSGGPLPLVVEDDVGNVSITDQPMAFSFGTGYLDFGHPERQKWVTGALVYGEIDDTLTISISADDKIFNKSYVFNKSSDDAIAKWDVSKWDEKAWGTGSSKRMLDATFGNDIRGNMIKFDFSGGASLPVKIPRIIIFFKFEEGKGVRR